MPEHKNTQNIVNYLQAAAERHPERLALSFAGKRTNFSELWIGVRKLSDALVSKGLKPGDRVIVMVPMSIELYVTLLGIIRMGAVAVFVDPWISAGQIASFCAFAEPKGFIGIPKSQLLRVLKKELWQIPLSVSSGRFFGLCPAKYELKDLIEKDCPGTPTYEANEDFSALISFTSGSSGIPKGTDRTHSFLNAQYLALQNEFHWNDDDIDMPMFPIFALCNLANGIGSIIPEMDFRAPASIDPKKIIRQILENKVSTITASPPFFDRISNELIASGQTLKLRRILSGGAAIRDAQLKLWRSAFPDTEIQVVYGSTEAEPVAHIALEERLAATAGKKSFSGFCMGKPTSLLETKIIKIHKGTLPAQLEALECAQGEVGELLVSGKHVCRDYYRNPQASMENKPRGSDGKLWHRMGDIGYFDIEGRFWLCGRVHSTIFRDGTALHPQIIEEIAFADDPRIVKIAALGINDEKKGELLALALQTIQLNTEEKARLGEDIKTRLKDAGFEPDILYFMGEPIPLDPRHNSKVDYEKLRRMITKNKG